MNSNKRHPQELDVNALLRGYEASAKGKPDSVLDTFFTDYRKKQRIQTRIVPATWKHVFVYAILNAFVIACVKLVWYETIGRPEIFPAQESVIQETN